MKFLITGLAISSLSNCAQNKYIDVQSSEIKHSSPEVISLYENQNEQLRREQSSGGFLSWLIDGLIGSDPDDDDLFPDHHHDHANHSPKRQRRFISKNGETLRSKLESKKQ